MCNASDKWGIMVRNIGMWGFSTWCVKDGQPELYDTEEEAKAKAMEMNERQGPVNRFNHYYAKKYNY